MSWRPKDWKNPHSGKTPELVFPQCCVMLEEDAFEAGADAILKSLKKSGIYGKPSGDFECFCMFPSDAPYDSPYDKRLDRDKYRMQEREKWKYPDDIEGIKETKKGWLVFIPEEKE